MAGRQKRKQPEESSSESDTGGEEKSKQNVGTCTTAPIPAPIAVLSASSGSSLPSDSAVQDQTHAKSHASSQWHKSATTAAKCFAENIPVDIQLISVHQQEIEANEEIVASIISTVMFCGTHDLPFRGKGNHEGVFEDLIKLKIDAGDYILKEHIENGRKNATYMSPQIQNEIISLCGEVIKDNITTDVKKAYAYSILADESSDISGKEQLSIGVRFFDEENMMSRRECICNTKHNT
ncbi:hypothetical protein J437_LFUL010143 [Ladona fulva]|uniref:DUF4371 domain-containing protein n=1 Tax=Ladona fulva TaxID=123851 RepID=A0A8K0K8B6_LADFU|nr:hypothetical protein J437_LFUL010143 [Ladona fulva]